MTTDKPHLKQCIGRANPVTKEQQLHTGAPKWQTREVLQ
jgi:hypothetical protein